MSIQAKKHNLISDSKQKYVREEHTPIDPKIFKTSPKITNNNNDQHINNNLYKNKNTSKKRLEKLNVNYTGGKNLKEKSNLKTDKINKNSSMTPKNISKFPRLSKNLNFDKTLNYMSNNKKGNLETFRNIKLMNESSITAKNNFKGVNRNDTSVSNSNKTREEKKEENLIEIYNNFEVIKFFY
jgi:hypothetical protein